jgi:hypothetical protein
MRLSSTATKFGHEGATPVLARMPLRIENGLVIDD